MKFSAAIAPATVLLSAARSVHAWGALGHRTVAVIAENYFTATTSAWVSDLLNGAKIDTIASFADSYDHTTAGEWSAPSHYIDGMDNPPSSCKITYPADCGSKGCVVAAIANYTTRIQNTRLSTSEQTLALEFLVHYLGDITQPLHTDSLDGTGGNTIEVTWNGASVNLHSVWDTSIATAIAGGSTNADSNAWAATLIKSIDSGAFSSQKASWVACSDITTAEACALSWAQDSNKFVCSNVVPNGVAALEKGDLATTYGPANEPVVNLQIAKAGYRLGVWLNKLSAAIA